MDCGRRIWDRLHVLAPLEQFHAEDDGTQFEQTLQLAHDICPILNHCSFLLCPPDRRSALGATGGIGASFTDN